MASDKGRRPKGVVEYVRMIFASFRQKKSARRNGADS
jgi:hypothetical protein